MKHSTVTMLSGVLLLMSIASSCNGNPPVADETKAQSDANKGKTDMNENRIRITVGANTFTATLVDNPTASAFKAMLPLSLKMSDLHGNEKFFHLPSRLLSNDVNPKTIETGDLMLWSSKSVVLFYKTFSTSYSYTKLGRIDNPKGLSDAVGEGDVTIKFEME